MKTSKIASLLLAAFLHFAPFASRMVPAASSLGPAPCAFVLRCVIGALAVAGSYHAVSAASAVLVSATSISGKVGSRLSYQIKISDGETRQPESWIIENQAFTGSGTTKAGMPTGLSFSLSTGIISGTPSVGGAFPVTITAFEHSRQTGNQITFTLTFNITGGANSPSITTQPIGGTVLQGDNFSLSVEATGTNPLTYQWRHGTEPLAGDTNSTLSLNSVQLTDAGDYTVVVSNSAGSVTSIPATLSVTPAQIGLSITMQPSDVTVHVGEKITLSVAATGSGPLNYIWQRNGSEIPDQRAATLTISAASVGDTGEYTVTVSDATGSVTSSQATVTVVSATIQSVGVTSGGTRLTFTSIPGRHYVIESADQIPATAWQTVGQFTATDNTSEFVDSSRDSIQRYWRFQAVP